MNERISDELELQPWQRRLAELVRDGQLHHRQWSQERFEELCRLAREEPLFPGQADAAPADGFRILASDDPALSPDAARWTPEDNG